MSNTAQPEGVASAEKITPATNEAPAASTTPAANQPAPAELLKELHTMDKKEALWHSIINVLSWDMETEMPAAASPWRGKQLSLLTEHGLERLADPAQKKLLDSLGCTEENPAGTVAKTDQDRAMVKGHYRHYTQTMKLPKELVLEMAEHQVASQQAWVEARETSDFSSFEPYLTKTVELLRKKADMLGYKEHIYDALLDTYEEGLTAKEITKVFAEMKTYLVDLLGRIEQGAPTNTPDTSVLYKNYDKAKQDTFGREISQAMGFDFSRGVMKESVHPFTNGVGAQDTRFTTRYTEPSVASPLFSTIHESGHALYEQGYAPKLEGTTLAGGESLSIHESQSRFWENIIGRSKEFWSHYYPRFQELFPEQTAGVTVDQFHKAINSVEPSMIRVDADEVTYGLHIILRFELEMALIEGSLEVKDLPEAWNAKMQKLLGITPANDAEGVLQDVHWPWGIIGYFPTYALGNLYAAQFYEQMLEDIPSFWQLVEQGNFAPITEWLRDNIHTHGSVYTAGELLKRITGKPLSVEPYKRYLEAKYSKLFL